MWNAARAGQIFFLIILLQIPLFRVPCRSGTCTSPLHITAAQLVTSKVIPHGVVKAMLYPGACIQTIFSDATLPQWSTLFEKYNLTVATPQVAELNRLELLIGSYFSVAGAVAGVLKPGRMSIFGVLLIVWGLIREGLFDKSGTSASIYMSPLMLFAAVCAFLSVKYDTQKVQRLVRPAAQPLKSSAKSKLK
ncbi:hypothetical protein L7F22_016707 [Adiantum nelumboides]|nr:hypothetical protein [Adiantum nelumboides]